MAKTKKDPKKKTKKVAVKAKTPKVAAKANKAAASKAAAPKKPAKPVKTAKAKAPEAKVAASKKSPKAVAAAPVKAEKVDKKANKKLKDKNKDDLGFDDMDDNFDDEVAQYEDLKTKTPEQMEELRALLGESDGDGEVEIALRDAEGRLYCKMRECDELSIVDGYCRFHYLKLWKKIQLRKKILTDGKLEKYIEELTLRYPDKYIEMIRDDLKSEKHFLAAIQELEIEDVDVDQENEDDQGLMDEVRGLQTAGDGDDDSF